MAVLDQAQLGGITYDLQDTKAQAMIAPAFSAAQAYSAGDSVTYNGTLYTFTADHAAGAWIGTDAATVPGGVTGEVADLKSALNLMDSEIAVEVKQPFYADYSEEGYISHGSGTPTVTSNAQKTDYIPLVGYTHILVSGNMGPSGDIVSFYDAGKKYLSNISVAGSGATTVDMDIPAEATYAIFGNYGTRDKSAYLTTKANNIASKVATLKTEVDTNTSDISSIKSALDNAIDFPAYPQDTAFFNINDYFNKDTAQYVSRYPDNGKIKQYSYNHSLIVELPKDKTDVVFIAGVEPDRLSIAVAATSDFTLGETYTAKIGNWVISTISGMYNGIHFSYDPTIEHYAIIYYSSNNVSEETYEANIDNYHLCAGTTYPTAFDNSIKEEYISFPNVLEGKQVLIFGDSITDCCAITVNSSDETSAYTWRNPSNSYVDAGGTTVRYSMWPKILKQAEPCGEIRNYAQYGASYKTATRQAGEERQNLQYQIDIAMNDLDNPNNVFAVDDYVPDIVIFALGTNDGTPADTYDSAMSATIYKADGVSIDVDATISALDDTKTIASARKAFMRVKQAFPMAQIYCVLPIQRADSDSLQANHNYLKQMAERYGCIIIDGAESVGITRDFNTWNALGTYLKDGLHPNEKGQNLMARAIISSLKSHYMPFGSGFNLLT